MMQIFVLLYIDKLFVLLYNDNMNKVEKIIEKMKRSPYGHSFDDCKKVLEHHKIIETSSKGSHHKFIKSGMKRPLIIAKHRPVDPAAIKEILELIEIEVNKND